MVEILPFAEEHLADAGRLLAARHRHHRVEQPLLSPRFEDPARAEACVADLWGHRGASGAVAVRGGRVVGYLLAHSKDDSVWGANAWVESAGHAVEEAEDARALYALAATGWADEGRTAHYVVLPAHDAPLVQSWFRLAFGHQHTHAAQPAPTSVPPPGAGLVVRRARREDIPDLARLEVELPRHHTLAPTFSMLPVETVEESQREWEADFENPAFTTFVAEHDGAIVGSAIGCSADMSATNSGLIRPDLAAFLCFAAVYPSARGLGAGRALGDAVAAWAASAGYPTIVTDWRETNLLSAQAWRGLGYRDTFIRLHRLIGH